MTKNTTTPADDESGAESGAAATSADESSDVSAADSRSAAPGDTAVLGTTGPTAVIEAGPTAVPRSVGPVTGPTAVIDTDAATDAVTRPVPDPAGPARFTTPLGPGLEDAPDTLAAPVFAPVPPAGAAPVPAPPAAAPVARPTVRWGALVWALIFGTTAALTLWILVDPTRRLEADAWFASLNPLAGWLYALILVGIVVALFGVVGLIRRGERTRRGVAAAAEPRPSRHHGDRQDARPEHADLPR